MYNKLYKISYHALHSMREIKKRKRERERERGKREREEGEGEREREGRGRGNREREVSPRSSGPWSLAASPALPSRLAAVPSGQKSHPPFLSPSPPTSHTQSVEGGTEEGKQGEAHKKNYGASTCTCF